MLRDQASITINRPVQEVFALLPNLDTPEGRRFGELQQIPEGPIRAGTTFEYQGKHVLRWMRGHALVTEYVQNRKLTLEQWVSGCFSYRSVYSYTLDRIGPHTRLTLLMEMEARGLFKPFEALMSSAATSTGMRAVEMNLSRIKATLEARPCIAEASEPEPDEALTGEPQDTATAEQQDSDASRATNTDWIEQAKARQQTGIEAQPPAERRGGWSFLLIYLLLIIACALGVAAVVYTFLAIYSPSPYYKLLFTLAPVISSLLVWLTGLLLRFWPGLAGRSKLLSRNTRSLAKELIATGCAIFLLALLWFWLTPGIGDLSYVGVSLAVGVPAILWRQRKPRQPRPTLFTRVQPTETEGRRLSRRTVLAGIAGLGVLGAGGVLIARALPSLLPPVFLYRGHKAGVETLAWSPDSARIASGDLDGIVQVWDATTGAHAFSYNPDAGYGYAVAWSPDGSRIASAYSDNTIHIWDASDGHPILIYGNSSDDTPELVHTVAWSPDGSRLASAHDTQVEVWDAVTGKRLTIFIGHAGLARKVAWSPDGTRLASAGDDTRVIVWDVASGAALVTYRGHAAAVYDLAWSSDGSRIVSGSADQTAQVWEAATGKHLLTYHGPTNPLSNFWNALFPSPGLSDDVNAVAWSPDGRHIAIGRFDSEDGVQVWDAATSNTVFVYRGHTQYVSAVAWSPDGSLIASGSWDETVQVWQLH